MKLNRLSQDRIDEITKSENLMDQSMKLHYLIKERQLSFQDISDNTRVVAHWRSEGLLVSDTNTHRYSLTEYFWIRILQSLRTFGMNLNQLMAIKKVLLEPLTIPNEISPEVETAIEEMKKAAPDNLDEELLKKIINAKVFNQQLKALKPTVLDGLIIRAIIYREEVGFYYFDDRTINLWSEKMNVDPSHLTFSHIYISISKLFPGFLLRTNNEVYLENFPGLNEKELKVIRLLRSTDVSSIEIITKDGNQTKIVVKKGQIIKKADAISVMQMLVSKGYHSINLSNRKNDSVYLESTITEKL